jgi:hypothetical protein
MQRGDQTVKTQKNVLLINSDEVDERRFGVRFLQTNKKTISTHQVQVITEKTM